ncbi:DUF4136 domain-containing protein [Bordetella holmesii]|uniref:PF13590 domain protein n=1 Tax=Bordetella holmesii CDC-H585-BH TaxID=1331206 RepID=A0A158M554_9BORD|nr:hypothetical protein H558_13350 [Bordetella holmesii H558]AOB35295.1 hypothetical protein BBB42_07120 [Bordetella holmesii]KAK85407.1 PF13590 domain protein [Bordetella holmesii CDC-H572-BH]KAK90780.1 PF13590 domain protein [Bordetella holmesii CDC-H585-BH]KAK99061.1 PF13590 domain protein [Bordetella holmesii CDC-H635-BH]KCV00731.1 PF13590 domain protein [Bordetella holmesii CDC-H719-BH]KCV05435.1 PF13590 domain protein [Bordetella holmesii CDC-H629-BH]KCV12185.1 PF13590 domain protein [
MLCVVSLVATLVACASQPVVRSDYDHKVDFAQYHSYGFMSPLGTDKAGYSSLLTERLKDAVRQEMARRGYVYNENQPDLQVNFSAKLENKVQIVQAAAPPMPYYAYRGGFYGGWPGYGWGDDVYQYTQGTLNVDLVDRRRKQLVWEGVVTGEVSEPNWAESQQRVDAAVALIFQKYPFIAGAASPAAK